MAFELRPEWLGLVQEEILEPERRIVDPHHHFFTETEAFPHYRLEDLWADTGTHNVEQTVFAQCGEHHYQDGPEELRPVGETEWVDSIAAAAAQGPADAARVGAIVGTAMIGLGSKVRGVLEAHCEASELFGGFATPQPGTSTRDSIKPHPPATPRCTRTRHSAMALLSSASSA